MKHQYLTWSNRALDHQTPFDDIQNGARYAEFLDNVVYQLLENVPLTKRALICTQQDDCLAHFSFMVHRVINNLCVDDGSKERAM